MDTLRMISLIQCYIHHYKNIEFDVAMPRTANDYKALIKMYNKVTKVTGWR